MTVSDRSDRNYLLTRSLEPMNFGTGNHAWRSLSALGRSRTYQYGLLIVLLALIDFARDPAALIYPPLHWEDGRDYFAFYYNSTTFTDLFRSKVGFMSLWANLIGFLGSKCPTPATPYVLSLGPFFLALFTQSTFFQERYRTMVVSDFVRFLTCLAIALDPTGDMLLLANTDYSIWNCLLLVILYGLAEFPRSFTAAHLLVFLLVSWSHPLAVLVIPLLLYRCYRDRARWPIYLVLVMSLTAYSMVGVRPMAPLSLWRGLEAVPATLHHVAALVFRTWFSRDLLCIAEKEWPYLIYVTFAGCAWLVYACWKRRRDATGLLGSVYAIFALSFLAFLGRSVPSVFEKVPYTSRYLYVQSVLSIIVIFPCLVCLLAVRLRERPLLGNFRWPQEGCCFLVLSYVWLMNLTPMNARAYMNDHHDYGKRVREFCLQLYRLEERNGSRDNIKLTMQREDQWPIEIDRTKHGQVPASLP